MSQGDDLREILDKLDELLARVSRVAPPEPRRRASPFSPLRVAAPSAPVGPARAPATGVAFWIELTLLEAGVAWQQHSTDWANEIRQEVARLCRERLGIDIDDGDVTVGFHESSLWIEVSLALTSTIAFFAQYTRVRNGAIQAWQDLLSLRDPIALATVSTVAAASRVRVGRRLEFRGALEEAVDRHKVGESSFGEMLAEVWRLKSTLDDLDEHKRLLTAVDKYVQLHEPSAADADLQSEQSPRRKRGLDF